MSWFISNKSQLSLRYESSNEFANNPKTRAGLNLSWLALEQLQFSLEYLRSDYRKVFVEDDEDEQLHSDEVVAMRVTYQF